MIYDVIDGPNGSSDVAPLSGAIHMRDEHAALHELQDELAIIRTRLAGLKAQIGKVAKAQTGYLDASAHAQLGDRPWAKLGAAFAGAFLVSRFISRIPAGLVVAVLARGLQMNAERPMRGRGRSRFS